MLLKVPFCGNFTQYIKNNFVKQQNAMDDYLEVNLLLDKQVKVFRVVTKLLSDCLRGVNTDK